MSIAQWFCKHNYQEIHKVKVEYFFEDRNDIEKTCIKYLYKCSKCGKFKKIDL